jgi:hypothetical protein
MCLFPWGADVSLWYYCGEKCCGARAYISEPSSIPRQHPGVTEKFSHRQFAPLSGTPPWIERQSDGWVLLKDSYGIRQDGSLWRWGPDEKITFFDAGPWIWVSGEYDTAAAGIKADGSLWTWGSTRGDGELDDWGGTWGSTTEWLAIAEGDVRLDCPIDRVTLNAIDPFYPVYYYGAGELEAAKAVKLSSSGLSVDLAQFFINDDGEHAEFNPVLLPQYVYFVEVINGGSGYTSPPLVEFSPPGASAEAVIIGGSVTHIRVTSGGAYEAEPSVAISGGGGSGCTARAHIESSLERVDVINPGRGYSPRLFPIAFRPTYSMRAWCDPPPCIGKVYETKVSLSGKGYFAPSSPSVKFDQSGDGASAVAYVDSSGSVTSVEVTSAGSGYGSPYASVSVSGTGSGAAAVAVVDPNGMVVGVRVVNPGSGYGASGTSVSFSGYLGGGAAANAVVEDGRVVAINVTSPGDGYFAPPPVFFEPVSPGRGQGASAVAVLDANRGISRIELTSGGCGYFGPTPPFVTAASSSGTGAAFAAEVDSLGQVTAVRVTNPGTGYPQEFDLAFTPVVPSLGGGAVGEAKAISASRYPTASQKATVGDAVLGVGSLHSIRISSPIKVGGRIGGRLPAWRMQDCTGETVPRTVALGSVTAGDLADSHYEYELDVAGTSCSVSQETREDGSVHFSGVQEKKSGILFPPRQTITRRRKSKATKLSGYLAAHPRNLCEQQNGSQLRTYDLWIYFMFPVPDGCTEIGELSLSSTPHEAYSIGSLPQISLLRGDATQAIVMTSLGFATLDTSKAEYNAHPPLPPVECSITADWYTESIQTSIASEYPYPSYPVKWDGTSEDLLKSDFRPKCKAIHRKPFAVPDTDKDGVKATPAELEAVLEDIDGYVYITEIKVKSPGYGYSSRPRIYYGPGSLVYEGGGAWHRDIDRPRRVGNDVGWTSVEVIGRRFFGEPFLKTVAIKDGNVYQWGAVGLESGGSTILTEPTRVGSSAVFYCDQTPDDRLGDVRGVSRQIIASPPEVGFTSGEPRLPKWLVYEGASLGSPETGRHIAAVFSEKPKQTTTRYYVSPVLNTPQNIGYLTEPSVSYHSLDGSDPFHITALIEGPDGSARAVVRGSRGDGLAYAILCEDGTLWSFGLPGFSEYASGEGSDRFWPFNASPRLLQTRVTTKTNVIGGDLELQSPGGAPAEFTEVLDAKQLKQYAVSLKSSGSGYLSTDRIEISYSRPVVNNDATYTVDEGPDVPCGGGQKFYTTTYTSGSLGEEQATVIYVSGLAVDKHGRIVALPFFFFVASLSVPSLSVLSGTGSGAEFQVVEITPSLGRSSHGAWKKICRLTGETWASANPPLGGVTKSGEFRRLLSPDGSQPGGAETDGFISVAATRDGDFEPTLSVDRYATSAAKDDGSVWVTDGIIARINSEIELSVTAPGESLTLPPLCKIEQVAGVAEIEVTIDGKLIAIGVAEKGSGYTSPPDVTIEARDGDGGSGGEAVAHICGPVHQIAVDSAGQGYRTQPLLRFSRPGMPAKAVANLKGYVDAVRLEDGGSGYSTPPSVVFYGDGSGAEAIASIKGVVSDILVTSQGSGYLAAPDVVVSGGGGSGCKAVAVMVPDSTGNGTHSVSGVVITNYGSGYTSQPSVTFSYGTAAAVAILDAGVESVALTKGGHGYSSPPTVAFSSGAAKASASVSLSVESAEVTVGGRYWETPTISVTSRETVSAITLTSPGAGYTSAPTVTLAGGSGAGASASCRISGVVQGVSILNGGAGYSSAFPPAVAIEGGFDKTVGRQAKLSAVVSGGKITSVSVDDPGHGYNSAPTVTFRWPEEAAAVAKISNGEVSEVIVVSRGAFYSATPRVVISGGGGSGATATASLNNGSVASISVANKGSGYTHSPDVSIEYDTYGEGAAASANISAVVSGVTLHDRGSGYKVAPVVLFTGGGGTGAAATAKVSADGSGAALSCNINGSVQYVEVTKQGSGYQYPPIVSIAQPNAEDGTQALAQSRILGKISSVNIKSAGSGYGDDVERLAYAFDGSSEGTITLRAFGGGISQADELPETYFIQKPIVVMENGIGVRATTTLSQCCLGVDHIGSKGSGSQKPTPKNDIFLSASFSTVASQTANLFGLVANTPLPTLPLEQHRQVWRGSLKQSKSAMTWPGISETVPLFLAGTPEIFLENERGTGVSIVRSVEKILDVDTPVISLAGGLNYVSRYESGEPLFTIQDAYSYSSQQGSLPAAGSATIACGAVASVAGPTFAEWKGPGEPLVLFSGGGGSGAEATYDKSTHSYTVTNGGSGYTSPPSVTIVDSRPYIEEVSLSISDMRHLNIYVYDAELGGNRYPYSYPRIDKSQQPTLDFVELKFRRPFDGTVTPRIAYEYTFGDNIWSENAHRFFDQGSVVDAVLWRPVSGPSSQPRLSDCLEKQHTSAPLVSSHSFEGTPPMMSTSIVKWFPPVDDGSLIRDVT